MATIVIDLMGDDENLIVTHSPEKDPQEEARLEEQRRHILEEIFKRSPQPTLEIVPVE
jgi:hypothetical protein